MTHIDVVELIVVGITLSDGIRRRCAQSIVVRDI